MSFILELSMRKLCIIKNNSEIQNNLKTLFQTQTFVIIIIIIIIQKIIIIIGEFINKKVGNDNNWS